jgi:drug/metabolite transporter (DMT)-like permease
MTDVFVVGLTAYIFVIPLSMLLLKEKFHLQNAIAVFLGFSGICLALRPGSGVFHFGILFATLGAIISALNQVIVKRLASTESELTIIFYHHLFLISILLPPVLATFTPMTSMHLIILFCGGVIGALAQYSIIHSFKLSSSSGLASAAYVMLIPNTIFDFFLYNKIPDLYIFGGLALILVGMLKAFSLQSEI